MLKSVNHKARLTEYFVLTVWRIMKRIHADKAELWGAAIQLHTAPVCQSREPVKDQATAEWLSPDLAPNLANLSEFS
jgi:hypothetical protein